MTRPECLFCAIVADKEPSWTIWEDADHVAFLTPFPNTPGFTVVATKQHGPSDIFALRSPELHALLDAAKEVATLLNAALGTRRTALIAEGMGIDHTHVKLGPLHGIPEGPWQPILSTERRFFERYPGYVSSHDGPRIDDAALESVAERIRRIAWQA